MKKEKIKVAVYSCLITMLVLLLAFQFFVLPAVTKPAADSGYDTHFAEMQKYIDSYSIFDFNSDEALKNASYGYLYGVQNDKYLGYYSPSDYAEYISDNAGNFTGIGLQFYYTGGTLESGLPVWRVLGSSPAETAGVKPGDILTAVDGESVADKTYNEILDILAGEEGDKNTIDVLRGDEALSFTLTRTSFVLRDVSYYLTDTHIGVISIEEFTSNVLEQFKTALQDLAEKGAKGLIFDVRNNPGGNLDTVCDIVELLVPRGSEVAIIEYKGSSETITAKTDAISSLPCVVLLNRQSASAAELFSSALRDLLGAPLVGEQSYGKGVGQQSFKLSDGSAIKLTTFKYYTKSRTDYNNVGLVPDYKLEMTTEEYRAFYSMKESDDAQKNKAKEILNTLITEKGNS